MSGVCVRDWGLYALLQRSLTPHCYSILSYGPYAPPHALLRNRYPNPNPKPIASPTLEATLDLDLDLDLNLNLNLNLGVGFNLASCLDLIHTLTVILMTLTLT